MAKQFQKCLCPPSRRDIRRAARPRLVHHKEFNALAIWPPLTPDWPISPQPRALISGQLPEDGFERHLGPRHPYRRAPPRMSHRNLRLCFLRTHHFAAGRSRRRDPPRRILRGGRCQRRARSSLCRSRRGRTRPPAVGPLQRDLPQKSRAKQRSRRTSSWQETETREAYPELVEGGINVSRAGFVFERTSSRQSDHRLEQVLRATDLLFESGGFGLIILDLGDLPTQAARRIPLDHMVPLPPRHRKQTHDPAGNRATPIAGSCSSLLLQLGVLGSSDADSAQTEVSLRKLLMLNVALLGGQPAARATSYWTQNQCGINPLASGTKTRPLNHIWNKNRLGGMKRNQ